MITRVNHFVAIKDKSQQLFELLQSVLPYIEQSEGCLSCELLTACDLPEKFIVIERWQSVQHHQDSLQAFPKELMHTAMSLLFEPPSGCYYQ